MTALKDLTVVASILLAGCTAASTNDALPTATCASDSECPADLRCTYDVCVNPDAPARSLGFRLVPPNSTTWKPQWVAPSEVSPDEPVTIGLVTSVKVAGNLLYVDEANKAASGGPSGVLTFRRDGQRDSTEQYRIGSNTSYSTYLLPGRYFVTFVPEDRTAPPVNFGLKDFSLDTDPELYVPARSIAVSGSLKDALARGMQASAVAGASVVAISRTTGAMSGIGTTDSDGFFTIKILPLVDRYDLRVTYDTDNSLREVTIHDALDCTETKCRNLLAADETFQVSLEAIVGDSSSRTLSVQAPDQSVRNFSGVVIELKGEFTWGTTRVRRTLDGDGMFSARLPIGSYSVLATTPQDFPLSGITDEISIDDSTEVQLINLPPKITASLSFFGLENEPAAGAKVEFQSDGSVDPVVVAADETGAVSALLEEHSYRVIVTPSQLGVARGVFDWSPLKPRQSYTLPPASVLTGSVLGTPPDAAEAMWQPVEDVTVHVIETFDNANIVVGEATTRSDGGFRVVIPALRP